MKNPPEAFEYVEPTLTALDNELREKVNEPHEGLFDGVLKLFVILIK